MPETVGNSLQERITRVRTAALDTSPVSGLTHTFYRYPARFSPTFAAAAIEQFSSPGDLVLDPFVGGGTTVVEAMARGRASVGSDINSLATFVTRAKTTFVSPADMDLLRAWADQTVPSLSYRDRLEDCEVVCPERSRNLNSRYARHLKKILALALSSLPNDVDHEGEGLARCAILSTSQWALDGRRRMPSVNEFRNRLGENMRGMIDSLAVFQWVVEEHGGRPPHPIIVQEDAVNLSRCPPFDEGRLADLVVTSPPYPGIHVLYHRWQVDGRKETPAPYWVAASMDGKAASYYTFGDHRRPDQVYFKRLLETMQGIRSVLKAGAHFVQAVAFQDPVPQLAKYLRTMEEAGFREARRKHARHIRRSVPGRRWHAYQKGKTSSSREIVLIHQAV